MFEDDEFSIDCATCIGSGTTACSDCIVTLLLANDDGPIDLLPNDVTPVSLKEVPRVPEADEVAIALLQSAGLIGAVPEFVPYDVFASHGASTSTNHPVSV